MTNRTRTWIRGLSAAAAFAALAWTTGAGASRAAAPEQGALPDLPLVQAGDIRYVGAFRPPAESDLRYDHSGHGLTFDPERQSLFVSNYASRVTEMSIPEPAAGPLNELPRAELRQGPAEVLAGRLREAGDMIGGLLVDGDDLIVSVYKLYDASGRAVRSHFKTSKVFPAAEVLGPIEVGQRRAGFVGGPMARIPAAWQALFDGPALTSLCCVSIISRTSYGPTATVFDPATLVAGETRAPGRLVLGYPNGRETLGDWNSSGTLFNNATEMAGLVWPEGTNSLLFFGRKGERFCYGEAEACGDPTSNNKGDHAYPYDYFVWAYDARDLEAVKRGRRDPWEVKPYATWAFDMPLATPARVLRGLAYDPETQRIYLSEQKAVGGWVVIRVLEIDRAATP